MKNSTGANAINNKARGIKMSEVKEAVDTKVSLGTIINAQVAFNFRPQVINEDLTRIDGVVYEEFETDNKGNPVFEADGVTQKRIMARKQPAVRRTPVVAEIPFPTLAYFGIPAEGVLDSNGFPVYETKELNALFGLIRERVEYAARDTLESSAVVDLDKVSWAAIAAKPKRASSALSKEDLDSFVEAFTQWATVAEKPARGIKIQAQLFKSRCRGVETLDATVINKIAENVAEFLASLESAAASEHSEAAEFIGGKLADAAMTEENLADLL